MTDQRYSHPPILLPTMEPNDVIELRFFGAGITPQAVRARELAELIISLEDGLLSTVAEQNPNVQVGEIYISLVDIKHESEGLCFVPSAKEYVVPAFLTIAAALSSNNFDHLSKKALSQLEPIQGFIRKRNCAAEFKLDNQVLATINATANAISWEQAAKSQRRYTIGETTLYASVLRAGGRTPKVALKIRGIDDLFFLDVSELIARKLAARLYETAKLLVDARWELGTYKLVDFKIKDVLPFDLQQASSGFEALRDSLGRYWDAVDDVEEVLDRDPFVAD